MRALLDSREVYGGRPRPAVAPGNKSNADDDPRDRLLSALAEAAEEAANYTIRAMTDRNDE